MRGLPACALAAAILLCLAAGAQPPAAEPPQQQPALAHATGRATLSEPASLMLIGFQKS